MKEFEWFELFEWFGPSPIEPFNSGEDRWDDWSEAVSPSSVPGRVDPLAMVSAAAGTSPPILFLTVF